MRKIIALLLLTGLIAGPGAASAGDPAAGKVKAVTCVACHGKEGISIAPEYPNLACQKEKYLVKSLQAYRNGDRNDPIMKPLAMMLADADVEDVAAYYAQLGCK